MDGRARESDLWANEKFIDDGKISSTIQWSIWMRLMFTEDTCVEMKRRKITVKKKVFLKQKWEKNYLGRISHPCPIIEPIVNHTQFSIFHIFSNSSGSWLHGCEDSQSSGAILRKKDKKGDEKKENLIEISILLQTFK